jgi:hypothetical protein
MRRYLRCIMHNYLRWICQQPIETAPVMKNDGNSCNICSDRDMTDWAPCNACSREWGRSGRRINWRPVVLPWAA